MNDDKVKLLIHKIGLKHRLQDSVVNKIVNSPYKFTRETITNLNVDGIETEEEFNKLKTNFMYIYIGKLYTNFNIFKKQKMQGEKLAEYHNLNKQKK
jgi:hypothetical protein